MSALAQHFKGSKDVLFLVVLDFDGWKKYISTKTIKVPNANGPDLLFEGIILQMPDIGNTFTLTNFNYSLSSVNIVISNKERFQDKEALGSIDRGTGKVYVWSEGLDWTDISDGDKGLIFKGRFYKEGHTKTQYSFSLVDELLYKCGSIPNTFINSTTWPNARTIGGGGSASQSPEQMVFGDWDKGIPLPCVDTSAFKYLASSGIVVSADADYTATTVNVYDRDGNVIAAAGFTFYPSGADGDGNACAYFDFTADQAASEPLSCSIEGIKDIFGAYGGEGEVIEHPGDIVHYIVDQETELLPGEISQESILTMKSFLPLSAFKFATIINSVADCIQVVDRILTQCLCGRQVTAGELRLVCPDLNGPTVASISESRGDILMDSLSFEKTPKEMIVNDLSVFYNLNAGTGSYEGQFDRNKDNDLRCLQSYGAYGPQPGQILYLSDVRDDKTAGYIADRHLDFFAMQHDFVKLSVPFHVGFDLREGDVVSLTTPDGPGGWTDERMILFEKSYSRSAISLALWRIGV